MTTSTSARRNGGTRRWAIAVAILGTMVESRGGATPANGSKLPDIKLVDAWDRSRALSDYAGNTFVVFYEDKDSGAQSQPIKDELRKATMDDGSSLPITIVPIADVKGYDYWPARGFVKDAVKKETKKGGQIIFLDWDGSAASAFSATHGESTVILYGKDGKAVASHAGTFTQAEVKAFLSAVRASL